MTAETVRAASLSNTTGFAALLAPAVERVFIQAMYACRDEGGRELVTEHSGGEAVGPLIDLRNPLLAGRGVDADQVADGPYRYGDRNQVLASLERCAELGTLCVDDDGRYQVTDRGRSFLTAVFAQHADVLGRRWASVGEHVVRLNNTVASVLDAAAPTGGPGWAVFAPPYEPPESSPGRLLLNRLSTLRSHRADAHAAAWQAAGLSATEIAALPSGPARAEIEVQTNERAGAPYVTLSADERLLMLADLAALD